MKIAIRTDAGASIGFGHLIRMKSLAAALLKSGTEMEICFFTRSPSEIAADFITVPIPSCYSQKQELKLLPEQLQKQNCHILIIDSYSYGCRELDEVSKWPVYSVYYDDLNRHAFNVNCVVNCNLPGTELAYHGSSTFLLGPSYALLRPEFTNLPVKAIISRIKNILITFGGADIKNATPLILSWLKNSPRFHDHCYHVVIGPAFTGKEAITREANGNSNIILYHNADISSLVQNCDLAVSAAGQTVHELMAGGLPALLIETADNQHPNITAAAASGAAINLGIFENIKPREFLNHFEYLCNHEPTRLSMSLAGPKLIDGRGAERLAHKLIDLYFANGANTL
ncbi:MAG: UDP-2,4-diacetamido-2,4,6-trideoxy-beta-L-altropyranose hydrolase [Syntrophomonadaceae bacterium]|jgi:UDP-2,4-diacetamido-2,4,6-trideoxy-beta-L-altropyranose hydrolase|nr:UDP-2,4-diacetamido-2,4,6-trideoxy-beta-L-altropyranose hydrolase [Syntrophomonadaceae bacterium]